MSNPLTLMVHIEAKPERAEEVKQSLLGILEPTRAEAGCEHYDFYVDNDHPHIFHFCETWTTVAHWEAHNESPHLADFLAIAETAVDKFTIHKMTKTDV